MDAAPADHMRELSVAIFGNAKVAAVVLGIAELDGHTAKKIADRTGVTYTLVRDVLQRFERAALVATFRDGEGARSPLLYFMREPDIWAALIALAGAVQGVAEQRSSESSVQSGNNLDSRDGVAT